MSGARKYHISFNTETPGLIEAVEVSIDKILVKDPKYQFRVDLVNDPLYPALVAYVQNNPPPKGT